MGKKTRLMGFLGLPLLGCGSVDATGNAQGSADPVLLASVDAADETQAAMAETPGLPDDFTRVIGAEEALRVAEEVSDVFRPIARARYAATIEILTEWSDPNWSLETRILNGRLWRVTMKGGILNEYATRDTLRWGICHEIGHFFGGFPFHNVTRPTASIENTGTFMASEGTADYFSTKDCLWRLWANDPSNAAFRAVVPAIGRERCDAVWHSQARRDICYRTIVVAERAIRWFNHEASIETPSTAVVERTLPGHFGPQCRLDTMVAGALCPTLTDLRDIPGLVPAPLSGLYGEHSAASEQDAASASCHSGLGARPACWFKPNMPDRYDCGDIPDIGRCEGSDLVICSVMAGVHRTFCTEGCILHDDPEMGVVPTCAEYVE